MLDAFTALTTPTHTLLLSTYNPQGQPLGGGHPCAVHTYAANVWLELLPPDCTLIVATSTSLLTDTVADVLVLPYLGNTYTVFASRLSHYHRREVLAEASEECARVSADLATTLTAWAGGLAEAYALEYPIYLCRHPTKGVWYGWIREAGYFAAR